MSRVTHPPEVKARALEHYAEHGPAEASRRMADEGHPIAAELIRKWASRAGLVTVTSEKMAAASATLEQRRTAKREAVRTKLIERCDDMLTRMDGNAKSGDCQHFATAAAILLDKFRLEMGEATGRTEHLAPDAAHAAVDELAARRTAA